MHPFTEYINPYLGNLLTSIKMDKRFVKGDGCYLYDELGNRYLDCIAAYGALPFGYNNSKITEVMIKFVNSMEPSFIQPSALEAAGELAKSLVKIAPQGLSFVTFTNSGAESVEAAIKLCRSATGRLGILSTVKGFHGKTLGALSATGNRSYQASFGAPFEGFAHIPFGDTDALENELKKNRGYYAAFIVEPIQGEGGIILPPKGYLKIVRDICSLHGVKLIFDEIQTGLGRTGKMFACQDENVTPDVMLLAKALGGGIMPIGACLSSEDTFNEEFAMKHSSTFAGNALACRIGLKVIEMLLSNDCSIIEQVYINGNLLKSQLQKYVDMYPSIVKTVRGKGFMLGVEIKADKKTFPDSLLGIMGEQNLFTPAVSSYLLNVEKIRVAPTLNGNEVLRIEPALIMSTKECNNVINSFGNMLDVLKTNSTSKFLSYLINTERIIDHKKIKKRTNNVCDTSNISNEKQAGRFAFLVHPLNLSNYCDFDDSLNDLNPGELAQLTDKFSDLSKPFVVSSVSIKSENGSVAHGDFIAIPKTADQLTAIPKEQAISELIYAISIAVERGAKIVGLGAYTSVVSMGGLYLKDQGVAITTGNSYTVISAVDAVYLAAENIGIDLLNATTAIVGATGSIGKGVAMLMADTVSRLILVGNAKNHKIAYDRLLITVAEVARHISLKSNLNIVFKPGSIAEKMSLHRSLPDRDSTFQEFIKFATDFCNSSNSIWLTTSIEEAIPTADIVICATSSTNNLLNANNIKTGAIVCDISRPKNIDYDVQYLRPDVLALDGGVISVPGSPDFGWNFGLEKGLAYACMAETMMLALEQHYEHTSIGSSGVTIESILFLEHLAQKHGFRLTGLRSFDETVNSERLSGLKTAREISFTVV